MLLSSPAFSNQEAIPEKYSCDGKDINPPLRIEDVPDGAESLVLIVDDPDAPNGTFDHWVVYNIPPNTSGIEEDSIPGIQGGNDFGKQNYGGPCPPSGTHRYFFKVYALDEKLDLPEGASKEEVQQEMKDHVLADVQLLGHYSKKS